MAELSTSVQGGNGKQRSKKLSTSVDLTAMVDLAFLLITFFMLTTSLAKPQAMDLAMPDKSDTSATLPVPASRTLTLCLGKNDQVLLFRGLVEAPIGNPQKVDYGKLGVRKSLAKEAQLIRQQTGKTMTVLIKPANSSTYENLVNTLDEMKIGDVPSYAIVDITNADEDLMRKRGL
ncbi:MAG: biopolymer transporter ExbD [Mucilaginibacter polytrichastri]|nr:biopolymer transporter ExbD [Mucilaginibacter polytrichastri]